MIQTYTHTQTNPRFKTKQKKSLILHLDFLFCFFYITIINSPVIIYHYLFLIIITYFFCLQIRLEQKCLFINQTAGNLVTIWHLYGHLTELLWLLWLERFPLHCHQHHNYHHHHHRYHRYNHHHQIWMNYHDLCIVIPSTLLLFEFFVLFWNEIFIISFCFFFIRYSYRLRLLPSTTNSLFNIPNRQQQSSLFDDQFFYKIRDRLFMLQPIMLFHNGVMDDSNGNGYVSR